MTNSNKPWQLFEGDCLQVLATIPAESVQTCITSPPYYGLRDYGTATWEGGDINCNHNPQKPDGGERGDRTLPLGRGGVYHDICGDCGARRADAQLGLEVTPQEYVAKLVAVFREVRRVLRHDGTLWLNLGDSYSGSGKGPAGNLGAKHNERHMEHKHSAIIPEGLKPKDLVGIPWRVAFALQADGWYLRQDIIWHKPNPMPESVTDRCTKAHEYIFLMTKSARYFYDAEAVKEPNSESSGKWGKMVPTKTAQAQGAHGKTSALTTNMTREECVDKYYTKGRNKRSVWTVTTKPFKGAHFATFPPDLIEPCVLAGSAADDTVLDPFNGAGTTGVVAIQHGRRYIGIDLNTDYLEMARKRIQETRNGITLPLGL